MAKTTLTVAGREIEFFTVNLGAGARWVFGGCRNTGGYATAEDAAVEAEAQLTGQYRGALNTDEQREMLLNLPQSHHTAWYEEHLAPLSARGRS